MDQKFGIVVKARTAQARRELARLKTEASGTFDGAKKSVAGLTTALTAAGAALGALSAGLAAFALKQSGSLETAFSEVASISSFSIEEMERLRGEVRALVEETGGNEVQAVKALYQIISAGATDASAASTLLGQSIRLAKAGLADLDTTARSLSSAVNAFGVEIGTGSEKLADMFFETVRLGQTTIPELAGSLGRVATVANKAGVSTEELFASIAALTKAGLSTDEAITAVRQVLLSIINPTGEAGRKFKDLGIAIGSAELKERGFAGIFKDIAEQTKGNIDVLSELIPNIRAIVAAAVFADEKGLQLLIDSTKQVAEGTGAVRNALKEFEDDLEFKFAQAVARAKGQMADFGRVLTPFAVEALEKLSKTIETATSILQGFILAVVEKGSAAAETLRAIGNAILFVGAALAGQAIANGIAALAQSLNLLYLNVVTSPAGVVAGLRALVNPITAIGAAVGVAALLIGKHLVQLKAAAVEAERIADAIEKSNQTIQSLGDADLGNLELVIGILKDFRAGLGGEAGPGAAIAKELAAAQDPAAALAESFRNLTKAQAQWEDESLPSGLRAELYYEAQQAAAKFATELANVTGVTVKFRRETQELLKKLAPGITEGAITTVEELDAIISALVAKFEELRKARGAATTPETTPTVERTDQFPKANAALEGYRDLIDGIRQDFSDLAATTNASFATMRTAAAGAFGPDGPLSKERIAALGDELDRLSVDELAEKLFGMGTLAKDFKETQKSLEEMVAALEQLQEFAKTDLTEEQLRALQELADALSEAIQTASVEMAAALDALKEKIGETIDKAKEMKTEFQRGAESFAIAIANAALNGQNILDAFVNYVKTRIVVALAQAFGRLALAQAGPLGALGSFFFGGMTRQAATVPATEPRSISVNVGLGPESLVEVITGDFKARRSLFRHGVRPEMVEFSRR